MRDLFKIRILAVLLCAAFTVTAFYGTCFADVTTRIKDVARVQGVRSNQLMGYGLVIGLNGTGDSTQSTFTVQSVLNMMRSFGILMPTSYLSQLQTKNIAAVVVTAQLPPFFKPGDTIDVNVASMGDAKSIQGGTLLQAPLKAANGQVYAVAQGPVSLGAAVSMGTGGQTKPFPTNGQIPSGAIVEKDVPMQFANDGKMNLSLMHPDFTTANRIAEAINREFGTVAVATDPATVQIAIPASFTGGSEVAFISKMELLPITTSSAAKIVINERTGTIVMGSNVSINDVGVSQNGLSVKVGKKTEQYTKTPDDSAAATSNPNQQTAPTPAQNNKKPETVNAVVLPSSSNVGDVVRALNAIGAKPSDIIAMLQSMKAAGAINAEIQVI